MTEESEVDRKIKEFQEKQGTKITLKVDKSQQMKDLEDENSDLKQKLTFASEKVFDLRAEKALEEAEKLGLDVGFISNPEELKSIERQIDNTRSKKPNKRDIPLSAKQLGLKNNTGDDDLLDREYENLEEMWQDINTEAKKGNSEAQEIALEFAHKGLNQLKDNVMEFKGKILSHDQNEKTKWQKRKKIGV